MTISYRYDNLLFSTLIPNYINVGTVKSTIAVSGTYATGTGANFTTTLQLSSLNTFLDVYLINQNTNIKTLVQNNQSVDLVWQFVSSETVQDLVTISGSSVNVQINFNNFTGSTITLTNQVFTVEVVEYQIPY